MFDIAQAISTNPNLLFILGLWTLPWKGVALWKSARQKKKWWFIALFVVNTIGILEILYIFIFSKSKKTNHKTTDHHKVD